jgi:hypothetical protein
MVCAKDIMSEEIMGRHYLQRIYFGCGPYGPRHVNSWIVCFGCIRPSRSLKDRHFVSIRGTLLR